MPDHAARMLDLLRGADFAHGRPAAVEADGRIRTWSLDYARPVDRRRVLRGGHAWLPPGLAAHTAEAYQRLPAGWTPAPTGAATDESFWRQVFGVEDLRWNSGRFSTYLSFPSPFRQGWPLERRVAELEAWLPRTRDPAARAAIEKEVLDRTEDLCRGYREQVLLAQESASWRLRDRMLDVPGLGPLLRRITRAAAGP